MSLEKARELKGLIQTLESAARDLMDRAEGIQAVERNGERLLASLRMLRINISDLVAEEDAGERFDTPSNRDDPETPLP